MNLTEYTRSSLLVRIKHVADDGAWQEFVELYAPLIYRFARGQGLQDADASDLTQDVLMNLTKAMQNFDYDRGRGSFRSWLFKVTHNALRMMQRCHQNVPTGTGDTQQHELLAQQSNVESAADDWDRQHQQRLFQWAANHVRAQCEATTWTAFWEVAMKGRAAADVAGELQMSVGAVYMAKSRVLARLKQRTDQFERDGFELP